MSRLHTYKSYIEYLRAEVRKRQLDNLSAGILRANGQVAELQAKNKRLKDALEIATDYVREESTRTTIGQLYDIEHALKG